MIVLVVTNERRVNDDDDDEVICTNFEAPRHVQTRLAATAAVKVVEGIIYDCYDIVVVITKRSLMDKQGKEVHCVRSLFGEGVVDSSLESFDRETIISIRHIRDWIGIHDPCESPARVGTEQEGRS